jgi:hypothetical protein
MSGFKLAIIKLQVQARPGDIMIITISKLELEVRPAGVIA